MDQTSPSPEFPDSEHGSVNLREVIIDPAKFIALLTKHDQELSAYVYSQVPSYSDAQDIIQETKMALWRSFGDFDPDTSFIAWARQTALHRILNFKRKKGREEKRIWFTDQYYHLIAEEYDEFAENHDSVRSRLYDCIEKLPDQHRELLVLRYFKDSSIAEVANQLGRTTDAIYRALSRIRVMLKDCLEPSSPTT